MKNIIDICKEFGIEIPADKHADFLKAVNGEYKTIAEHGKVLDKLTAANKRAETAEEALKGFEGIDPAKVNEQLAEANKKVKEAQEAAQKQLEERDFNDALKNALDGIKFTSAAARRAFEADVRANCYKVKDGVIIGLSDVLSAAKKSDASAFVDEKQEQLEQNRARFTVPNGNGGNNGTITPKDIQKIKDHSVRQKAWAQFLTNNKGE